MLKLEFLQKAGILAFGVRQRKSAAACSNPREGVLHMSARNGLKTIGILGGMGAAASVDLYARIVDGAQRRYRAEQDREFPEMILYNLCLIDFDETGITDESTVKEQLLDGMRKLQAAGADFVVVPCNTVHRFADEMQAAVSIPLVSIIEATKEAVAADGRTKVGILSSRSTRATQLYENALRRANISFVSAEEMDQGDIDTVIGRVISGSQDQHDAEIVERIAKRYIEDGATAVILGCTELPLAFNQTHTAIPLYDSTRILAAAALKEAYGK
jgi:aspartate racemase